MPNLDELIDESTAGKWAAREGLPRSACPHDEGTSVGNAWRDGWDKEAKKLTPIPMVLHCPRCGEQHIDEPNPAKGWTDPPHRSHECQGCGTVWRPADIPTQGVAACATASRNDTWHPFKGLYAARAIPKEKP